MLSSVIQGTAEVRILSMVKESNAYMAHRNWLVLCLLQTHNQAVDPNLVRLSEAYTIAAAQMVSATDMGADEASVDEDLVDQAVVAWIYN